MQRSLKPFFWQTPCRQECLVQSQVCAAIFLFLSLLTDPFVAAGEIEFFLDVT